MSQRILKRPLVLWAVILFIVALLLGGLAFLRDEGPILAGKSTVYWLEHLPSEASTGFVHNKDHPLEQAGPEIIPYLIKGVDGKYGRDASFLHGLKNLVRRIAPAWIKKHLGEDRATKRTIQTFSAFRLGQFGTNAAVAVPTLTRLLQRPGPPGMDQSRVIQALGWIGPGAAEAVPALVARLRTEPQPFIKSWLAQSLIQIGKVPDEAVPALEQLKGEDGHVAGPAVVAIWFSRQDAASLDQVHASLANPTNSALRAHTANSLALVPSLDSVTINLLISQLGDTNQSARQGAAIALAQRVDDPHRDQVFEVLISGVETGEFQWPSTQKLGLLGKQAYLALPTLRKTQANPTVIGPVIHRALADSIKAIESDSASPTETRSAK